MLLLYSGLLQDVLRLSGGLVGLLFGALAARRRSRLARRRTPGPEPDSDAGPPPRPEARILLALVMAISAIGPALAAVSHTAIGPLSVLQYIFLSSPPDAADVREVCADPALLMDCRTMQAQIRLRGLAPAFLSVIPVLLLLVMAEGLRRGRRFALWGAVVINTALAVCGAVFFELVPAIFSNGIGAITSYSDYSDVETLVGLLTSTLQPLLVVVLLLVYRRAFDVVAPRRTYRGLALTASVALVAVSVLYVGLGYLIRHQFEPVPTFGRILADLPLRFVPPGYLDQVTLSFVPTRPLAEVLHEWTGALFWMVVLFATIKTFWRSRLQTEADDLARARQLLVGYGGSELSYMATWRGNSYWFSPDGRVVVAYRVVASVALTIGEPIGHPAALPAAVRRFADFCVARGWIPCFYGVTAQMASTLADSGWRLLQVAEETQLPLAHLEFTGRKWQDVRTAINKAGKAGITAEWHHYRHSSLWITEQIRHISEEWLHDKGMPEMGFTLGGLHELGDDDVRCLLAVDEERRVHAVTSWMPVYRDGRVTGWTLDFMRRRADAYSGVMEFLIASAARQFQHEGADFISLSGAPLARRQAAGEAPAQSTVLQRLLDLMGGALEPVYGFRSLLAFKSKFQPVYQPLFMAYPDPAALPAIGGAITRAYLPQMTLYQGLRLVLRIVWGLRPGPRRLSVRPVAPKRGAPPAPPRPTVPQSERRKSASDP
jgi:lysylphosphatidylglycerol synthetase-like protein (DUF2156 family)